MAGLRLAGDAEDVAVAFGVDVVAGLDLCEIAERVRLEWAVPDLPQGVVFGAERQRAKVWMPRARAARIWLRTVTASRNQT